MPNPDRGPLGDAVEAYLAERGLAKRVAQASVVNEWRQLVGAQLARVSRPDAVDASGTLWVSVRSTAWIQELQMMSPVIIRDLARKGRRVKRIRWRLGTESDLSDSAPTR